MEVLMVVLNALLPIIATLIAGTLVPFIIAWFRQKTAQIVEWNEVEKMDKYIIDISKIIEDAVIVTNQVYVEALKKEGAFTKESQIEAFKMTYTSIMKVITPQMLQILQNAFGDSEAWIRNKIESYVNQLK